MQSANGGIKLLPRSKEPEGTVSYRHSSPYIPGHLNTFRTFLERDDSRFFLPALVSDVSMQVDAMSSSPLSVRLPLWLCVLIVLVGIMLGQTFPAARSTHRSEELLYLTWRQVSSLKNAISRLFPTRAARLTPTDGLTCSDHRYTTEIVSVDPLLIYINNFITPDEADDLLELG